MSQCNAADWRKRRRPAPRRDTVEAADCKILLLYIHAIGATVSRELHLLDGVEAPLPDSLVDFHTGR